MAPNEDHPSEDQALLDEAFDRFVAQVTDGEPLRIEGALSDRPDLRDEIEGIIQLAKRVAVRRSSVMPEVADYEIVREIGRGAMGVVFLARQLRLGGRLVALKVMPEMTAMSESSRRRFLSEVRALGRLRHPSIVAVHDVIDSDGVLAYAMEWIDGISLDALIRGLASGEGRPDPESVARLLGGEQEASAPREPVRFACRAVISVANALSAVHSAGLLHRDVKPSNVLLRRDGSALLSDFGLVREEGDVFQTRAGTFVGTVAFAAPEQLRGNLDELSARSDVYSLGATLYYLLALRPPFEAKTTIEVLQAIESGPPPPVRRHAPWIPRDLETICAKAMSAEQAERYQTAAEFAEDLERFVDHRPIRARRPSLWTRTSKLVRRNRTSVASAVAGGGLAAITVGLLALNALWIPGFVDRQVREARRGLLQPAHMELSIAEGDDWAGPEDRRRYLENRFMKGEFDPALRLSASIAHYDRALAWRPWRKEVQRERAVASLALEMIKGESPSEDQRERLTLYASDWHDAYLGYQGDVKALLRGASQDELRDLGLLAFLLMDAHLCNEAWSRLERVLGEKPLLDSAEGMVLYGQGQYSRAYPRLQVATDYFEDAGFLEVAAAHTALRCKDFEQARLRAQRASGMSWLDPYDTLLLVEGDLAALAGDLDTAREKYSLLIREHKAFQAKRNLAVVELTSGHAAEALSVTTELCRHSKSPDDKRLLVRMSELWWSQLDTEARLREIIKDLPVPVTKGSLIRPHLAELHEMSWENQIGRDGGGTEILGGVEPFTDLLSKKLDFLNQMNPPPSPGLQGVSLGDLVYTTQLLKMDLEVRRMLSQAQRKQLARMAIRMDSSLRLRMAAAPVENRGSSRSLHTLAARALWSVAVPVAAMLSTLSPDAQAQSQLGSKCGAGAGDTFGSGMVVMDDVNGDGVRDFVIGATGVSEGSASGSLMAFSGVDPTVLLWQAFGNTPGDRFGGSVDLLDDLDSDGVRDLVVGVSGSGGNTSYIQRISGLTGVAIGCPGSACSVSGSNPADGFGRSLVRIDDLNGDGVCEILVGAPQLTGGSGYVQVLDSVTLALIGQIDGPSPGSRFGTSIDDVGDIDGDGWEDFAVGAYTDGGGSGGSAAIYSGSTLTKLGGNLPSSGAVNFGIRVLGLGDVTGDSIPDVAVGARGWGTGHPGKVRSISGASGYPLIWQHTSANGDQLSSALLLLPDLDGDGIPEIASGAPQPPIGGTGYARVLSGATGALLWQVSAGEAGDRFGQKLAGGDVNGDGVFDLLIGAPGSSCGGADSGEVWFYSTQCAPPENYCSTSPNSAGPGATISTVGGSSIPANDLVLQVSGAPSSKPGLFFYGREQVSVPLSEGVRCVGGRLYRLPVIFTDPAGDASHALDITSPQIPAAQIRAGDTWNFQFWYRDPAGGPGGSNLSDGLEVCFGI